MTARLKGRTALITGASRGIGFAIAQACAREGANLILSAANDSSLEDAKQALVEFGVNISCIAADLSRAEDAE